MSKSKFAKRYPKEFRHQMVELHRAGRTLTDLTRQFGPTPWAIGRWVKQADCDEGRGDGGLIPPNVRNWSVVSRQIESCHSRPPVNPGEAHLPVYLDPNMRLDVLIRGLGSVGLVFRHDQRTNATLILPIALARQEACTGD
jgi:transposase-like protein